MGRVDFVSRTRLTVIAGLVALLGLVLGVNPTQAQTPDYPGPTPTTAPRACTLTAQQNGPMLPNAVISITLGCESVVTGRSYTGVLNSTPIALPVTVAGANNRVTFNNVRLPADFALNAFHTVTLVDAATGNTLGSTTFFVNGAGAVTGAPDGRTPGTNLPKTGTDYVGPALRGGAVLLATGGIVLLVSRRRRSGVAAA